MKETLDDLRQRRAEVKRQLEAVGRTLSTLQAELAMVDYRIASHKDYKPVIQRPVMFEDFDNGRVTGLPAEFRKKKEVKLKVDLSKVDFDLDI